MNVYGQLVAAQLENLSSAPAGVPAGRAYFDTTLHMPRYYDDNGTTWRTLADLTSTQTLTGKTLTGNIAVTLVSGAATITLPTTTGTLATLGNAETLALKTLTGVVSITLAATGAVDWAAGNVSIGASIGANTMTLGGASSTVRVPGNFSFGTATVDGDDFVLNQDAAGSGADWKLTLHRPTSGMSAAATITLPTATATLATLGLTETLAGKTLTTPALTGAWTATGTLTATSSSDIGAHFVSTGTTSQAFIELNAGSGTTSSRVAYISYVANETSSQTWNVGLNTTKDFTVNNGTAGTTVATFAAVGTCSFGHITATGTHRFTHTSTANATLTITNADTTASSNGIEGIQLIKGSTTQTTSQKFIQFYTNAGSTTNGSITSIAGAGAQFTNPSDRRLKTNIQPLSGTLALLCSLAPVSFNWLASGQAQSGFIAQDMQTIFPEDVTEESNGFLSLSGWSKQDALIVAALQELNAKFEAYKAAHP